MCEFHLEGTCFHPKLVEKGLVGKQCQAHNCNQCTNKRWQQEQIHSQLSYYQEVLKLANTHHQEILSIEQQRREQNPISRIFAKRS